MSPTYTTSDMYLAAALISSNFEMVKFEKMSPKSNFVFADTPELQTAIQEYWDEIGEMGTRRKMSKAIRDLKARLFS